MNVYLPADAINTEERQRRFLDWRFLSALTALILVAFLVWAGFRNYGIREAEAEQKNALIAQLAERNRQIANLEDDIAALSRRAQQDRRDASRERERLMQQQARMIRLLQAFGVAAPADVSPQPETSRSSQTSAPSSSTAGTSTPPPSPRESRPQPSPQPPPDDPGPAPEPIPTPPPDDPLSWLPDLPPLPLPL